MATDEKSRVELEAAVYRRLVEHLRSRTDVQNIDLMNLAGFCRNCLSNWMKDAADEKGVPMTKDESRETRLRHALRRMARQISERSDPRAKKRHSKKQAKSIEAQSPARNRLCSAVDERKRALT